MPALAPTQSEPQRTLIDALLAEQCDLTAVDRFARWHEARESADGAAYQHLLPVSQPKAGEQYAFEVDLDKCSGCKSCVTACHSLNGLEESESWRNVGLLLSAKPPTCEKRSHPGSKVSSRKELNSVAAIPLLQHVTTACHHCVDPACLNGCPVLAYEKSLATGIVCHLDDQCIGCQYCVMMCPYEVPRFSTRLGIVRKCDMCQGRLAVAEAPACAQACPNEAIRIAVVTTDEIRAQYRDEASAQLHLNSSLPPVTNSFLPASPNPARTLPTTRFIGRQLPADLIAADHTTLRLEPAHWPLVFMLVLTQAAAGLFLAAGTLQSTEAKNALLPLGAVAFGFLATGTAASAFHLGQPLKGWRAFLGWRRSWLSREIIMLNLFAAGAGAALGADWLPLGAEFRPLLTGGAAALGLGAVFCSAMVYVDTGRPFWCARLAFGNFFGTAVLLGATCGAAVLGGVGQSGDSRLMAATQSLAVLAFIQRTILFVWRRVEVRLALRNPANPIHQNARVIRELLTEIRTVSLILFLLSTAFGLLAIADATPGLKWWAGLTALSTLSAEILQRYVFFAAAMSRRMPGGITS